MKSSQLAFLFALCATAWAQSIGTTGPFAGPTIMTNGIGGVGKRSGQDVDLNFFGYTNAIYDTGITPLAVQNGQLVRPAGQPGVEAGVGAYGTHQFRRSMFGLDYNGNFRHYLNAPNYDGSNQQADISYSAQVSRRWLIDTRASAGTQTFGTTLTNDVTGVPGAVDTTSLLFDNRTNYLQTSLNARYLMSRRTIVSMGGTYYTIHRQAKSLVGVNGYTLNGTIQHQLTRRIIISGQYQHMHYDYPRAFGESDINYFIGQVYYQLRSWQFGLGGGAYTAETQGIQNTTLEPALAALLGVGSVQTAFYKTTVLPVAMVSVSKKFRKSSLATTFNTTVTPGNGVYLTSQQKSFSGYYSYTGVSRLSLSIGGSATRLQTIGQNLQNYDQVNGYVNVSYRLVKGLNLTTAFYKRYQDIINNPFQRNSSRISIGLYFRPGNVPVSFH